MRIWVLQGCDSAWCCSRWQSPAHECVFFSAGLGLRARRVFEVVQEQCSGPCRCQGWDVCPTEQSRGCWHAKEQFLGGCSSQTPSSPSQHQPCPDGTAQRPAVTAWGGTFPEEAPGGEKGGAGSHGAAGRNSKGCLWTLPGESCAVPWRPGALPTAPGSEPARSRESSAAGASPAPQLTPAWPCHTLACAWPSPWCPHGVAGLCVPMGTLGLVGSGGSVLHRWD